MTGSGAVDDKAILRHHKASPLCWAARLLSLGYGLLIALYALGVFIAASVGRGISRGEAVEWVLGLLFILLWFIPLALAVIAWRWHLVGGTLITAGSAGLYLFFAHSVNMQWGIHLYLLPLLAGGILHLLAWHMEKRTRQLPQPA